MKQLIILSLLLLPVTFMMPEDLPPDPEMFYQEHRDHFSALENNFQSLQNEYISKGVVLSSATAFYVNNKRIYGDFHGLQSGTMMPIASLSKPFTSYAVLKLAEEGKLDLYSPVSRYLQIDRDSFRDVRLIDLLMQVSGIPYDSGNARYINVRMHGKNYSIPLPVYPAGEQFIYSNANYRILSLVIEAVTNRKFQEYMKTEIFSEFDMDKSLFGDNPNAGAAGMASSMDDIARFAMMMIQRKGDGFRFHSGENLVSPFAPPPNMESKKDMDYYGLGWRVKLRDNRLHSFYHSGVWHGTLAVLVVFPEKNAFFIHLATPPDIYKKSLNDYRWQLDMIAGKFAGQLPDAL